MLGDPFFRGFELVQEFPGIYKLVLGKVNERAWAVAQHYNSNSRKCFQVLLKQCC